MRRMTNFQYSFTRFLIIVLLGLLCYGTVYIAISTFFHPDRKSLMAAMAAIDIAGACIFLKWMPKRHYTKEL